MYPLLLKAPIKDYLWGGNRLVNEYGFESKNQRIAEAWMLACNKDLNSVVKNGEFSGETLNEVINKWGKSALGVKAQSFECFPISIKLIDAKDRLPIYVHPDDEYALFNEGEHGKTEMWYVIDCDADSKLIYGFNQNISQGEFLERLNNNNLSPVCNYVQVKKGDVFFIEPGTMHALGKGILIAEVQQNSSTTYRISDYGRPGIDGKPQKLHIKQALEVTKTQKPTKPYGNVGDVTLYPFGTVKELASCEYFTTEIINLDGNVGVYDNESFISLVILDGEVTLSYTGGMMKLKKGDSVFIPAMLKIRLCGTAQIMYTHM